MIWVLTQSIGGPTSRSRYIFDVRARELALLLSDTEGLRTPLRAVEASPIFGTLDRRAQLSLARTLRCERWREGSELPISRSDRFRLIVRGRVKMVAFNPSNGRALSVQLLGPGDVLDCIGIIDQQPSSIPAWALDSVQTLCGSGAQFREWVDRVPAFRCAVHQYIGRQMREVCTVACDLALYDTRARLARFLLRYLAPPDEGAAVRIDAIRGLSHEELASLIGSTRVVISRLLGELRRDEIVDIHKGSLRILDLCRLQQKAMP